MCHLSFFFVRGMDKVELVGGGSVINGATPSIFLSFAILGIRSLTRYCNFTPFQKGGGDILKKND